MRFIYMDEAGTDAHSPITVVVGLIVNADTQLMDAEAAIREVSDGVPGAFRQGFVFHADTIWNDVRYRAQWSLADRIALLKRMMALPRRLQIPIAFALVRRSAQGPQIGARAKLSKAQEHHIQAFAFCVASADKYIRDFADHSRNRQHSR